MTSSIELTFSLRAEANIRDILQYTLQTWGTGQRDAYQKTLENAFQRIRAFPDLGRAAASSDPAIRELRLQHHTIVYRHDAEAVTILRLVNPRQLRR